MQVMLDGRLFPVAEASNKKVAKKDAAAATLRILLREIEGGGAEEGLTAGVDQAMDPTSDVPVSLKCVRVCVEVSNNQCPLLCLIVL